MKKSYTVQAEDNNSITISSELGSIYLDIRDNNISYIDGWDIYLAPNEALNMSKILKRLAKGLDSDEPS